MSEYVKGEWKLLKVWECHKCKTLIRNGREVSDHRCDRKDSKQVEVKVVEKIVEKIVEKPVYIEKEKIVEKIVEKPVYIEKPIIVEIEKIVEVEKIGDEEPVSPQSENNVVITTDDNHNEKMCVDVWKEDFAIKDSKDIGYRENVEIEVYEKGKEKKRVIIKNGKMIKKPEGIEIIGENTPKGFIVEGIIRKK